MAGFPRHTTLQHAVSTQERLWSLERRQGPRLEHKAKLISLRLAPLLAPKGMRLVGKGNPHTEAGLPLFFLLYLLTISSLSLLCS